MNKLEILEQEALNNNIGIHDYYLGEPNLKGIYIDGHIALNTTIHAATEKACVLAEELGHYHTSAGNILDQSVTENRKQERTARLWAYNKQIGLQGIIRGFEAHCCSRYELAEYLDVTEDFLQEALDCYKEKYGESVDIDGYTIFFHPCLAVMEKM